MSDAIALCIVEVMRLIIDSDPSRRERGADEATDVLAGVGGFGRHAFAVAIATALALGGPHPTVESQLNALAEIATFGELPHEVLDLLRSVDRSALDDSTLRQLDEILEGQ